MKMTYLQMNLKATKTVIRVANAKLIYPLAVCEGFKKRFFPHHFYNSKSGTDMIK